MHLISFRGRDLVQWGTFLTLRAEFHKRPWRRSEIKINKMPTSGTGLGHSSRKLHSSKGKWGSQVSWRSWKLLSGSVSHLSLEGWVQVSHSEGVVPSRAFRKIWKEVKYCWEYDSLASFLPYWDDLVWFQFNPNALRYTVFGFFFFPEDCPLLSFTSLACGKEK